MSTPLLSSHLHVDGISKSYPDRRVLTDISFTVTPGEVVGLIGENGSGKTTLLKIIAGLVEADAGSAVLHTSTSHARLGLLHQVPPFGEDVSVSAALEEAVRTSREAERELEDAAAALALDPEDPATTQRYGDALTEAERLDVWSTDQHISTTVNALGLANIDGDRLTGTLSGGQRARLSLAWLLLNRPHALLLDEPTNHLDDSAVDFLRTSLASWPGPVLLASHDRAFLDEVATVLIDLDPAPRAHALVRQLNDERHGGFGITRFTGSYSDYLLQRAADRERWIKRYRDEQDELKRLRSSAKSTPEVGHVDWKPRTESRIAQKFYGDRNARVVSRRIGEVERKLIELERDQVAKPPRPLHFAGLGAGADSKRQGIAVSAAGVTVRGRLSPVSFRLEPGEHLLVTGANGSGKSTLLAVLAGLLPPSSGEVIAPDKEGSIGMLRQEVFLPDPHRRGLTRTATQAYQDAVGEERFEAVPLASFGLLEPRDLNRPLGSLSVGQQRRVELAALLADPPQLLLLDEPTNHLSLALATALEEQIPGYPGTVIVASHDRWLRARWQGRILSLEGA